MIISVLDLRRDSTCAKRIKEGWISAFREKIMPTLSAVQKFCYAAAPIPNNSTDDIGNVPSSHKKKLELCHSGYSNWYGSARLTGSRITG